MRYFFFRNLCRLSLTLGFFCFLEIYFQWTEGTRPNYLFPWGYYNETLAVFGGRLFGLAYVTWTKPRE